MTSSRTLSAERFARFAPNRGDVARLALPSGPLTLAALTAAKTRLEIQRDAFADPDATLAYLNSQLTAVEAVSAASKPVAAASLDDQVIVGDVVPPRARPAAVPSTGPSMLERLGATAAEVARAQALGVSPEALACLLVEPPKKPAIFDGDVAPHNTAAEVIAAVEQGTPLAVLIAHHDEWVPIAEVAGLLEVEMPPHEYRQYRRYVDGPLALQLWSAGYDRDAAAAAAMLESPLKDLATAEKLGMGMWRLKMALRTMTFDEAQRLHRHHPELLASNLVVLLTPAELAELCKSGAIPTSGDLTGTSQRICGFLEAGVAPRDIAWLLPAGAQPTELERVKRDGGSLDDYVKLRKAGWSEKCQTGLGHWAADEVVTLLEVFRKLGVVGGETFEGNEPRAFNRIKAYGELGLSLAQATALAREGCTVDTLEKYYLSVGLTVDQAIKAIAGGG